MRYTLRMKKIAIIAPSLLLLPFVTYAQSAQSLITGFTKFLSTAAIPFLLGVAFLFFVVNGVRYFVLGSSNEDGREKAKALAIYGVLAFVIIIIFWGLVNILVDGIGLGGETQPTQDYVDAYTAP